MERVPVSSTNIRSVGYDAESLILEVEFNGGAVYQYQGVPQAEFDGLMAAASKGSYFHANIRNRYPVLKL